MARLFVLDAMGLAYRAYYAFIRRPLTNSRGENTSAIFGFGNSLLKVLGDEKPEYCALAWDGPGPTFRHERYAEYKATRKPIPDDLLAQIPALEDVARALGVPIVEVAGVEADDVMGTLAKQAVAAGHDVALVTSDKDMLQLVNDHVRVLSPPGRGDEYAWIGRDEVEKKWGVGPESLRDVLALMGDTSDNVPGVPGVGPKTAKELIREFGSIDALYDRLGEVDREALRRKLAQHKEQALLSRELVTVKTDVELPCTLEELRRAPIRRDTLLDVARQWEVARFERVARDLGVPDAKAGPPVLGRPTARRGTTAEMRGTGVKLREEGSAGASSSAASGESSSGSQGSEDDESGQSGAAVREPTVEAPPAPTRSDNRPFRHAVGRMTAPPSAGPNQETLDLWSAPGVPGAPNATVQDVPSDLVERVHAVRARAVHGLALLPVVERDGPFATRLVGLGLAARDGTACYMPILHPGGPTVTAEQVREWLAPVLADPRVPKIGLDLKHASQVLEADGMALAGLDFDVRIASFLCDPERDHSLGGLAGDLLGERLDPLIPDATRGRGRAAPSEIPSHVAVEKVSVRVSALPRLADALRSQLDARDLWKLYTRIEHPLIDVLLDMERTGIAIDRRVLEEMSANAAEEISGLEERLYELAGERINLNSGQQLARILFEKLGLKTGRKTKTGYSTDQSVLESLAAEHEFPAKILEYRALAKLKSTYLDALPEVAHPRDGRIHTTYNQTGAATGRLSSSSPNLQNIPMRTPQGRAIRRAFVAGDGKTLIGADYSQIELRIMAHLSDDPNLIAAFESGEDVHATTARRIFGVESGALDPQLRARAKIVNFGVMYGMGARSLSQQMGISLKEARAFIDDYFELYARVREFLDGTVESARSKGYVQTLLGRRRYLPDLESLQGARRAMAERAAINTPIQGTAADLMKLAMIRVHGALKRSGASASLLLQVHDELVLECSGGEAEEVSELVRKEMENCFPLRVPLEVSLGRGPTWFDVHA